MNHAERIKMVDESMKCPDDACEWCWEDGEINTEDITEITWAGDSAFVCQACREWAYTGERP